MATRKVVEVSQESLLNFHPQLLLNMLTPIQATVVVAVAAIGVGVPVVATTKAATAVVVVVSREGMISRARVKAVKGGKTMLCQQLSSG